MACETKALGFALGLASDKKTLGSALDRANSRILLGFLRKKRQPRNNPRKVESCDDLRVAVIIFDISALLTSMATLTKTKARRQRLFVS